MVLFWGNIVENVLPKVGCLEKKDKQRGWPYKGVVYIRGVKPVCNGIAPEVFKRCNFYEVGFYFANKLLMENMKLKQQSEFNLIPTSEPGYLSKTKF